jgi:hypothetical protein
MSMASTAVGMQSLMLQTYETQNNSLLVTPEVVSTCMALRTRSDCQPAVLRRTDVHTQPKDTQHKQPCFSTLT